MMRIGFKPEHAGICLYRNTTSHAANGGLGHPPFPAVSAENGAPMPAARQF
jgi:hypothetical protein